MVSFFNVNDIKGECYGGDSTKLTDAEVSTFIGGKAGGYGKSAYMLVYECKNKNSMRVVKNSTEVAADKEVAEIVEIVEFKSVTKETPQWLTEKVTNDNIGFVIDRQIFHDQFFKLISLVLKHITQDLMKSSGNYDHAYSREHFWTLKLLSTQISQKVMFDFLTHFGPNEMITPVKDSMNDLINYADSPRTFLLFKEDKSILLDFLQRVFDADDMVYFFKLMMECDHEPSRRSTAEIASKVMAQSFHVTANVKEHEGNTKDDPKVLELQKTAEHILSRCF